MFRDDPDIYIILIKKIDEANIEVVEWEEAAILVEISEKPGSGHAENVTMYCQKERDGKKRLTIYRGGSGPTGVHVVIKVPKEFKRKINRKTYTLLKD